LALAAHQEIEQPHRTLERASRQRANGRIENYHTLLAATAVAPGHAKVVPLFPDFIAPQDGSEKQDCERNAVKRWHDRHGERLRPLRPVSATISSPASPSSQC
jgi:hypothetical protein